MYQICSLPLSVLLLTHLCLGSGVEGGLNLVGVHICIEKNNTAICLGIGDLIGFEEKDNRVK